jgi:hypothetical protein
MSAPSTLLTLAVIVAAAAFGLAILKAKLAARSGSEPGAQFKAKSMLTPNELEFLTRLEAAVPECRFCPQVAMGAFLEPSVSKSDRSAYASLRGKISQKYVDYVMQDKKTGAILAIIELDDRTHDKKRDKDAARDAVLASAGYRTVRWDARVKPDLAAIRAELLAPAAPARKRETV